jgi:2C-methyl-D-erythritol 2,4-cyclodiphosphate synthase
VLNTTMEDSNVGKAELTLPSLLNMTMEDINVGKTELDKLGFMGWFLAVNCSRRF